MAGDRISLLKKATGDLLDIELLDAEGRVIGTGEALAPLVEAVTLQGLAAGTYYVRVSTLGTLARYDLVMQVPSLRTVEQTISSATNNTRATALKVGAHTIFPLITGTSIGIESTWSTGTPAIS